MHALSPRTLKYAVYLVPPFEGRRANRAQAASFEEGPAQPGIFQEFLEIRLAPEFKQGESAHQSHFRQAAAGPAEAVQEEPLEGSYLWLVDGFALADGFFFEPVHDSGDINAVGTAGGAGNARGADPDGPAAQERLHLTQAGQADDPVREQVHGKGQGATGGTFFTLVTRGHRKSGFFSQTLLQGKGRDKRLASVDFHKDWLLINGWHLRPA
jgi:hypothetical protein